MFNQAKGLMFILILTVLLLLPFLHKAYHIDDTIVLYCAKAVAQINWYGQAQSLTALSDSPLISVYVAHLIKTVGESEVLLHISFLIFPVMAVFSMYFVGRRFTRSPMISSLILISAPAFLISSTNIMPDVALLAFYLSAVCAFIYGIDRENKPLLLLAGFIAGLACLTKYIGLTLIPMFILYSVLTPRRKSPGLSPGINWDLVKEGGSLDLQAEGAPQRKLSKGILSSSVAFVIFAGWHLHSFLLSGEISIIKALYWFKPTPASIMSNFIGSLTYIGSVAIAPFLYMLFVRKRRDIFIFFVAFWLSLILAVEWSLRLNYTLLHTALVILSISAPLFASVKFREFIITENTKNRSDTVFLLSWLGTIFCYNILVQSWFVAPRYILILTPPLILLFVKRLEISFSQNNSRLLRDLTYIGIALSLALSILIASADYIYAGTYRSFVNTYAKYLKTKITKVRFRGHWGFQYYMEKEGFRYLSISDMPQKDEIVIMPSFCDYEPLSQRSRNGLKFIGIVKYGALYPVRTVFPQGAIHFYSYALGSFPYGISQHPLEIFNIWQAE